MDQLITRLFRKVIWVRPHLSEAEEYMKSAHGIIMEVLMR